MRSFLLTVAALVPLFAGCGPPCSNLVCGACAPPLSLTFVDDGTGVALAGVTIDHPSGNCDDSGGTTRCWIDDVGQGTFHFVASASGYRPENVEAAVTLEEDAGCCSCGYMAKNLEIRLTAG